MLLNEPHPLEVKVLTRRYKYPQQDPIWLEQYVADEGYDAIRKALTMQPEEIIDEVKKSSLRGRGGAGFPTGLKWSFVDRKSPKPKYIVVNGDEGEPGTCKDRIIMGHEPHRLIEGCLVAGRAIGSNRGWVYIRGEYREYIDIMDRAIQEAYDKGYLGDNVLGSGWAFHLSTHTGAGSYECGEESALLESLEGKRGNPRLKPPFPATSGAFQAPTIVNNVETYSAVPEIILKGGEWFAGLGTPRNGGTRLVCLSGHLNRPGVYEVPLGMNMMTLINEVGGGVWKGRKLKAVIPGGSSSPILRADECDIPADYDSLAKAGSMLGSGATVVLDETADIVKVLARLMAFYAHESCGWCIPCREGTTWLKKIMARLDEGVGTKRDIDMVDQLAQGMMGRTFCALGDAAAMPAMSYVRKFREEFEAKIQSAQVFMPAPQTQPLVVL
ncbi:NADH-quinone oxidoreductase subunit NuoF [Paludibaculum fermentans]|uniref:NADH-quinone oxidoreductase subunit F n=1 Tax=Paludibaculum fermentans TaxID=1473598 RepID=A0A7S7NKE2_PALFE|nr:NADH-quinone oxidoreductase subunit NuoF [Paludibaculum fermentans]QOY85261.1 NADH-quinone oxidoreductase subunit NuoF [Paludibaculum fermentans]